MSTSYPLACNSALSANRRASSLRQNSIGPRRKVLLVEDDPVQGKMEAMVIKKAGYDCDTVTTLHEATRRLSEENTHYDAVVTDHNLNLDDDADTEKHFQDDLSHKLFPEGVPKGAAEGILLAKWIDNQSTQKPHTVLISAVEGVEEETLAGYAHAQHANFLKKPISASKIQTVLAHNPFAEQPTTNPPEASIMGTGLNENLSAATPLPLEQPASSVRSQQNPAPEEGESTAQRTTPSTCNRLSRFFKTLLARVFQSTGHHIEKNE